MTIAQQTYTKRVGIEGVLTVNGQAGNGVVKDVKFLVTETTINILAKGSFWEKSLRTKVKSAPLAFDVIWDPTDPLCLALAKGFWESKAVAIKISDIDDPEAHGGFVFEGMYEVTQFGNDQPLKDNQTYPVTLVVSANYADPTWKFHPAPGAPPVEETDPEVEIDP